MSRARNLAAISAALVAIAGAKTFAQPRPAPDEGEARASYFLLTTLGEGETLKHIPTPFPAYRAIALRETQQSSRLQQPPEAMYIRVHPAEPGVRGQSSRWEHGSATVGNLCLRLLDRQREAIEANEEIFKMPISGDWIIREEAPMDVILPQLEQILESECKVHLKFSIEPVERDVIVARGKYRGPEVGGLVEVSVRPVPERPYLGSGQGSFDQLLLSVGRQLNCRIISKAEYPADLYVTWRYDKRPAKDAERAVKERYQEGVLKHLSEQIGVTFTAEKAMVPVLMVKKAEVK